MIGEHFVSSGKLFSLMTFSLTGGGGGGYGNKSYRSGGGYDGGYDSYSDNYSGGGSQGYRKSKYPATCSVFS